MSATVSKFEEGISNFKEKCLRLFVVVQVVMETMLCAYVYQVEKVWGVKTDFKEKDYLSLLKKYNVVVMET